MGLKMRQDGPTMTNTGYEGLEESKPLRWNAVLQLMPEPTLARSGAASPPVS